LPSHQLEEVKSVFKTVDEDEYAAMVSKRRQDDFVEEDCLHPTRAAVEPVASVN